MNNKRSIKSAKLYYSMESYTKLFKDCENLEEVDLTNIQNIENIKEIDGMYENCSSLKNLDMTNIDISEMKDLRNIFKDCSSVENINLSNWDTSNAKKVDNMLSNVPDLNFESWNYDGYNYENFTVTEEETNYSHIFPWNDTPLTITLIETDSTDAISTSLPVFTAISSASLEPTSDSVIYKVFKKDGSITDDLTTQICDVEKVQMIYNPDKYSKVSFDGLSIVKTIENLVVNDKWTDASRLFHSCESLVSLDTSNWDVSNITDMNNMFCSCKLLKSLDLTSWNTGKVTSFWSLFNTCSLLKEIKGLENLDTKNIRSLKRMFYGCTSLTSLDLSNWDTSNLTEIADAKGGTFYNCSALKSIKGIDKWNTANINNIDYLFYNCKSLDTLDLSSWDLRNVNSSNSTFSLCKNDLTIYYLSFVWDNYVPTSGDGFNVKFKDVSNIYTITPTETFALHNHYGLTALSDWGDGNTNNELTHTYSTSGIFTIRTNMVHDQSGSNDITEISLARIIPDIKFSNIKKLNKVDFTRVINSDILTSLNNAFTNITSSTSLELDFTGFKSTITSMTDTFKNSTSLRSINIKDLNTSRVLDMSGMFNGCTSLVTLFANSFDTYKVRNCENMFLNVPIITNWGYDENNYLKWNLYEVESSYCDLFPWSRYMEYTIVPRNETDTVGQVSEVSSSDYYYIPKYTNCLIPKPNRLKIVLNDDTVTDDLSTLAKDVKYIRYTYSIKDTTEIDFGTASYPDSATYYKEISNLTVTNKITKLSFMGCQHLLNLNNINTWDVSNIKYMTNMFNGCSLLTSLDLSNWSTSIAVELKGMFKDCSSLISLNASSWDVTNVFDATNTFYNCSSLQSLDLSGWDTYNFCTNGDYSQMFYNVPLTVNWCYDENNYEKFTVMEYKAKYNDLFPWNIAYIDYNFDGYNNDTDNIRSYNSQSTGYSDGSYYYYYHYVPTVYTHLSSPSSLQPATRLENSIFNFVLTLKDGTETTDLTTAIPDILKVRMRFSKSTVKGLKFSGDTSSANETHQCHLKEVIDIVNSRFTSLTNMFTCCFYLTSVNLSNLDVSNVTTMNYMFDSNLTFSSEFGVGKLTTIDFTGWDTRSLISMYGMFRNQGNLREIKGLECFNTENITDMSSIFYNCPKLKKLDLSSWNTSKVTSMGSIFSGCTSLKSLDLSTWDLSKCSRTTTIFKEVPQVINWNYDGNNYNKWQELGITESSVGFTGTFPWNIPFELTYTLENIESDTRQLNYIYNSEYPLYLPKIYSDSSTWYLPTSDMITINKEDGTSTSDLTTLVKDISSINIVYPKNTYSIRFEGYNIENYHRLNRIEKINTLTLNSLENTFRNCIKLDYIDTDNSLWMLSNVTSVKYMFANCQSLGDISFIETLDMPKLTNIEGLFYGCPLLENINLPSNWDISKVTSFSNIFNGCSSLVSIDNISNIDVSRITDLSYMFADCSSLTSLDLTKWNTGEVSNYSNMFDGCNSNTEVYYLPPLWTLPTSGNGFNVTFIAPYNIYTIDLSKDTDSTVTLYNTSRKEPFTYWGDGTFDNQLSHTYDTSETSIFTIYTNLSNSLFTVASYVFNSTADILPTFDLDINNCEIIDTDNGDGTITRTIMSDRTPTLINFANETDLLEVKYIDTYNLTNIYELFCNCTNLTKINLSNFDTSNIDTNKVDTYANAFYNLPLNIEWNYIMGTNYKKFKLLENDLHYSGDFPWNIAYIEYTIEPYSTTTTEKITSKYSTSEYRYLPKVYRTNNTADWYFPTDDITLTLDDGTETTDLESPAVKDIAKVRFTFNKNSIYKLQFGWGSTTKETRWTYIQDFLCMVNADIKSVNQMFNYCRKLRNVNLSNFSSDRLTSLQYMFYNCYSLEELNLENADFPNVTDTSNFMYSTKPVKRIYMANCKLPKSSITNFFNSCSSLTSLDLTNVDFSGSSSSDSLFYNCSSLTSLDLSTVKFDRLVKTANMFKGCSSLTSLILPNLKNKIEYAARMFEGCSSLTSLDISNLKFEVSIAHNLFTGCTKLETIIMSDIYPAPEIGNCDWSYMFYNCSSLKNIDTSKLRLNNVIDTSYMFYNCSSLTSLDLSHWDTAKDIEMQYMFHGCSNLTSLNLNNWNTAKVTNMSCMFKGCSSLTSLNLSSFNTSIVTDMSSVFSDCSNLNSIIGLSDWNTGKVTNMSYMFQNCSSLTPLDLSGWNTEKVTGTNAIYMFSGCTGLTSLNVSGWNTSGMTDLAYMFQNCTSLNSLNLSTWNVSNVTGMNGVFKNCSGLTSLNLSSWNTEKVTGKLDMLLNVPTDVNWNYDPLSVTSYANFILIESDTGYSPGIFPWSYQPIEFTITPRNETEYLNTAIDGEYIYLPKFYDTATSSYSINFPTIIITKKDGTISNNFSTTLAKDVEKIEVRYYRENKLVIGLVSISTNPYTIQSQITTITKLYTDRQTDMSNLFTACKLLTSICDFKVTNLVTTTHSMFRECQVLPSITGIANWDTSNVTDMTKMFQSCELLETLDLTSFNTGKVTSTSCMFDRCYNLNYLNISGWDTSSVANMESTFSSCCTLTEIIGIESLDVSNVTNMKGVFAGWGENIMKLFSLDLSGWDISKVTNMTQMFQNCKSLTLLNLSTWDTSNVIEYYGMLKWTNNLTAEQWCYDGNNYNKWELTETEVLYDYRFPWNETYIEYTLNSTLTTALNTESYSSEGTVYLNLPKFYKKDGSGIEQLNYNDVIITKTDDSTTSDLTTPINQIKTVRVYYNSLEYNAVKFGSMDGGVSLITGINYIDMRRIKDITAMFANCQSLASIDLSSFDTSNITDISNLFYECRLLYNINLSNWKIGKDVIVTESFHNVPSTTTDWVYDNIKFIPTGPECGFGTEFPWPSVITEIIDFTTFPESSFPDELPSWFREYNKKSNYFRPATITNNSNSSESITGLVPSNRGTNSSTSWSCFEVNAPSTGQLQILFNQYAESSCDYGSIHISTSTTSEPGYSTNSSTCTRLFAGQSNQSKSNRTVSTMVTGGTTYYLHFQYDKDVSVNKYYDALVILKITFTDDEANMISETVMDISEDPAYSEQILD